MVSTQADTRTAASPVEYTVRKVRYAHSPSGYVMTVTANGADVPLFVIAPSAALQRLSTPKHEIGIYAARTLRHLEHLGKYTGTILGTYDNASLASRSSAASSAERDGSTMLLVTMASGGGYDLIDGREATAPYLCLMNDPANTGLTANVLSDGKGFFVRKKRGVKAFDFDVPLDQNAASELLWEYGAKFWK